MSFIAKQNCSQKSNKSTKLCLQIKRGPGRGGENVHYQTGGADRQLNRDNEEWVCEVRHGHSSGEVYKQTTSHVKIPNLQGLRKVTARASKVQMIVQISDTCIVRDESNLHQIWVKYWRMHWGMGGQSLTVHYMLRFTIWRCSFRIVILVVDQIVGGS